MWPWLKIIISDIPIKNLNFCTRTVIHHQNEIHCRFKMSYKSLTVFDHVQLQKHNNIQWKYTKIALCWFEPQEKEKNYNCFPIYRRPSLYAVFLSANSRICELEKYTKFIICDCFAPPPSHIRDFRFDFREN